MRAPSDELVAAARPDDVNSGLCVLVVEDDEADVCLIHRALADNPAIGAIVLARDGVEALALIDRGVVAPDVALIDLHMPRMDGFGLLFAFAGRPEPRFPMVVLTSSSSPSDAVRSRLRRAIRVVTKPDTAAEMYAVLKITIEGVCHPNARNNSPSPRAPEYPMEDPYTVGLRRISADGGLE